MTKTFKILDEEFPLETIIKICTIGMSALPIFLHSSETDKIFYSNQEKIMDYLNIYCMSMFDKSFINHITDKSDIECINDIKTHAIWMYFDCQAHGLLMEHWSDINFNSYPFWY
jgi:hypothetical protein